MPTYTVTYIDIVQKTYEVEDEQAAIAQFVAEEVDESMDIDRNGFRVKDGASYGEGWLDTAADLNDSKWYDNERCEHPGCGNYLYSGECEDEEDETGAHAPGGVTHVEVDGVVVAQTRRIELEGS